MRIGFREIITNPVFPVNRMLREEKHQQCADDLHARVLVVVAEAKPLYIISIDAVEIYRDYRDQIKDTIETVLHQNVDVIVSATHSHNCPCLTTDMKYRDYMLMLFAKNIPEIDLIEYGTVRYCYQYSFFDQVGKSRIKEHECPNIYAETLSFYKGRKRIGTILIHNVHPTIKKLWTGDFTAEYPGNVIRNLKKAYPKEFFTFMLGPAGDISPRYVRENQEYNEIDRLSAKLLAEYKRQLHKQNQFEVIDRFSYEEVTFPIRHFRRTAENVVIPANLSVEEKNILELIRQSDGGNHYSRGTPCEQHLFCHLILSAGYSMIVAPYELFSGFYDAVDKNRCSLITVSNGFDHYVTDLGPQRITRELFSDNVSDQTKREMMDLFARWSRQDEQVSMSGCLNPR